MKKTTNWKITLEPGYPQAIAKAFFESLGLKGYDGNSFSNGIDNPIYVPTLKGNVKCYSVETSFKHNINFNLPSDWKRAEEYINADVPEVGKYYAVEEEGISFSMVGKVIESNEGKDLVRGFATTINSDEQFQERTNWCFRASGRTIREATKEEIEWLDRCIEAGKYLEKDVQYSLPIINGYDGKIELVQEEGFVTYGCARLNIKMIRQIAKLGTTKFFGNREVGSIRLRSSGVHITVEEAQQIAKVYKALKLKSVDTPKKSLKILKEEFAESTKKMNQLANDQEYDKAVDEKTKREYIQEKIDRLKKK